MISAINSTRFASANNYKRTYTNTNQNTNQNINQNGVGYQQSFGMRKYSLLATALSALLSLSPANLASAADKGASKASHITPIPQKGLSLYEIMKIHGEEKDIESLATAADLAAKNHLPMTPIAEENLPKGNLSGIIRQLDPKDQDDVVQINTQGTNCAKTIYAKEVSNRLMRPTGMVTKCDDIPTINVRFCPSPDKMQVLFFDKLGKKARRGFEITGSNEKPACFLEGK